MLPESKQDQRKDLNLGEAVYFVVRREHAEAIAKRHPNGGIVVKCEVDLGRCKCLYGPNGGVEDSRDLQGDWRRHFDSVYRRHTSWEGVLECTFREYAVKKENVKILKIYSLDGKEVKL